MDDSDYYVDVIEAVNAWYDLVEQDEEPTEGKWSSVFETIADAVEALREFEMSQGTSVRDAPWGGTRVPMVEVLDAAAAYTLAFEADELNDAEADATLDRLGAAVEALRVAEAELDAAMLRGEYGEVLQRVMQRKSN